MAVGTGAHVRCLGKGRKERATPLTKPTARAVSAWIQRQGQDSSAFLFPNARGGRLSADAAQSLVKRHVTTAQKAFPSLAAKRVTPHVLRHTAAMELLQAGVDRALIAIWLGHESVETTQIYLDANLALKEGDSWQNPPDSIKPGALPSRGSPAQLPQRTVNVRPDYAAHVNGLNDCTASKHSIWRSMRHNPARGIISAPTTCASNGLPPWRMRQTAVF